MVCAGGNNNCSGFITSETKDGKVSFILCSTGISFEKLTVQGVVKDRAEVHYVKRPQRSFDF